MFVARLGILLVLLAVCSFSPGFLLVRKLRWKPLETLAASVGASLIVLYLASAAIYGLGLDWAVSCWCFSGASAALLAVEFPDLRALLRAKTVQRALAGYGVLLAWTLLILSLIRHYSGGGWSTDWQEHFERILYFLNRFPVASPLVEGYAIPARPPMMNLLGAFFLAQVGDTFAYYQIAFAFLNLLAFLSCYLMAPAAGLRGKRRAVPLVALFAASPVVMQNTTYAWTKLLAAFYVILALWFYLRGWQKNNTPRMVAAFLFLAAGMLVHYSTGPYFVFLGLHYLIAVLPRRKNKWREFAMLACAAGLLLATWFVWSVAVYGTHTTVASNTSVTPSQRVEGSNTVKIAANFFDTIVPHPLRSDASTDVLRQASALGYFRDYFFLIYQTNAIFGIGLFAGPVALYLLYRTRCSRKDLRQFWYLFVAFCLVVGVAVHGERETFGVAHVTLQPLMLLGLCLVAGSFTAMPRALAWVVVAGCVLDFAVGVVPQVLVESMENSAGETVFAGLAVQNGRITLGQPELLSHRAWLNWFGKHQYALASDWLRETDRLFPSGAPPALASWRKAFEDNIAQDGTLWHGWYSRHDGEMMFLGDWVVGVLPGRMAPTASLVTIWLALYLVISWVFVRSIPHVPTASAPKSKPLKRRSK